MDKLNITVNYERFDSIEELESLDKELCKNAVSALGTSYSPYSKFRVGAAIRLSDGTIVFGSNQENVAYPSGLCAERVALFSIGANYPDAMIKSIAITAKTEEFILQKPVTSCGGCLQVMAEFEMKQGKEIEVLFYCLNGEILKVKGIKNLLPFAFEESRLVH